jgi:hypothetical protein
MKVLAISLLAGAALAGAASAPASAIPASNLTAAASEVALSQSVRYVRHHQRFRARSSGGYYSYGTGCRGFAPDSPSSPCYP